MKPISSRFSHSTTHQYYHPVFSIRDFLENLADLSSSDLLTSLAASLTTNSPAALDFSYTSLSHSITVSTMQPTSPNPSTGWNESITAQPKSRTEIGILSPAPPLPSTDDEDDAHSITLSGGLLDLGSSQKFSKTLFSTPSRHHTSPAFFSASFKQPTGLHPTLALTFPDDVLLQPSAHSSAQTGREQKGIQCALHTHLTLPSYLFLDKYAFRDELFLSSHNLTALRSLTGATDLELPDWKIEAWGSAALFELSIPSSSSSSSSSPSNPHHHSALESSVGAHSITIPLHTRYLPPSDTGYAHVPMPYPVVFWACTAPSGSKFATNPFDRTHLGYEGLFGERTAFYHLTPIAAPTSDSFLVPREGAAAEGAAIRGGGTGTLMLDLTIPVLDLSHWSAKFIEPGTVTIVLLGFAWVVCCLFRPLPRNDVAAGRKEEGMVKKVA